LGSVVVINSETATVVESLAYDLELGRFPSPDPFVRGRRSGCDVRAVPARDRGAQLTPRMHGAEIGV